MSEQKQQTLADLKPGENALVAAVGGSDALHRRLLDMGLTPGVRVLLQKTAPMGDPLEIHLRGYALTLRREDAGKIDIREDSVSGKGDEKA
jgi:ferrous iron transport protein A